MPITPSFREVPYQIAPDPSGLWNWRIFYPKRLGEFDWNGWAITKEAAEIAAISAISHIRSATQVSDGRC